MSLILSKESAPSTFLANCDEAISDDENLIRNKINNKY